MNTQQNQNDIQKKGVKVNPSRDIKYDEKEKDFSGEFGQQIDEGAGEEINPAELDDSEVDLDRGGVEFDGGQEEEQPSPDKGMSSDLGGDISQTSGPAKKDQDNSMRQ